MLAAVIFTVIVALVTFYEYRHHNGSAMPFSQTFNLRNSLERLNPRRWNYNSHHSVASPGHDVANATTKGKDTPPKSSESSREARINNIQPVEYYKPSRGDGTSTTLFPSTIGTRTRTPAQHRPRTPLQLPLPASTLGLNRPPFGPNPLNHRESPPLPFEKSPSPGQKAAFPGSSFSDLPIPVVRPSAPAPPESPSPPQRSYAHRQQHHEERDYESWGPEADEGPWRFGFAVRNDNVQRAGEMAEATAPWHIQPDTAAWHTQPDTKVRGIGHLHSSASGGGKRRKRNAAGKTMRRVVARFGERLVRLDDEYDYHNGNEVEVEHCVSSPAPMPMQTVEIDAGAPVTFASDVSPMSRSIPYHADALRSHPPSTPPLRLVPDGGLFNDVRSPSARISTPPPVHSWRGSGSLKRQFNRMWKPVWSQADLSPDDTELFTVGRDGQYQQPQASSSEYGQGGGVGVKTKMLLWKFRSGRKRNRRDVFEGDGLERVRRDSLQQGTEASGVVYRGEEKQGVSVKVKRMRLR